MVIRNIVLIFVLVMILCSTAFASTIISSFECKTGDGGGTMTHYSYLKEPELQQNGYTKGYKTGSLSYLENGTIDFSDDITYYDGQIDAEHGPGDNLNSSVYHKQNLEFDGDRGISEFYGKGFFPSNRAMSAWKKIRYGDPVYNTSSCSAVNLSTKQNECYDSGIITVVADVGMGPNNPKNTGRDYDFEYNATVENGVIEIHDATGWTNRTGAKMIDWEQEALMKGDLTVTNDLKSKSLFFPAAGLDGDWLPCCFDGTHPPIENRDKTTVLLPAKILPSEELNKSETINNARLASSRYSLVSERFNISERGEPNDIVCTEDNCSGYKCIYTYDEGVASSFQRAAEPIIQVDNITVSIDIPSAGNIKDVLDKIDGGTYSNSSDVNSNLIKGDVVIYEIEINHNSKDPLTDIRVTDILPDGLGYESSTVGFGDSDEVPLEPVGNVKLTWNLSKVDPGLIEPTSEAWIYLTTSVSSNNTIDIFANSAYAKGNFRNETNSVKIPAESDTVTVEV